MIPQHMKESLARYVEQRIPCGGFLTAILSNDLKESFARADDQNINLIKEYVIYCYNEIPSICWGSPERVEAWLKKVP